LVADWVAVACNCGRGGQHSVAARVFVEAFRARLISLDIHSGAVSQFSADNVPTGVVVSPNGAYVYVAASYDNTVLEFDARNVTRGALRTIPVGNRPVGISIRPDGAVAYTANALGNSVTAIDVSQNPPAIYSLSLVNEKHTNPRPLGIALDATGTRAYVSLGGDNSYVIALDTSEKQPHLAADLSVPSSAMSLGDTKLGIATSPTSSLLYAIAPGKNQLSYYDMGSDPPALGPVSNTYPNSYPVGVSVDGTGNRVLVQGDGTPAGDPNNGRLFVYEARTGQQQWTLRLGKGRALVGNVVLKMMCFCAMDSNLEGRGSLARGMQKHGSSSATSMRPNVSHQASVPPAAASSPVCV
jgi:YVTN family beta-propeller protein